MAKTEPRRRIATAWRVRIGRDLLEWAGPDDCTRPARHRNREREFRLRIERELRQLRRDEEWPLAV